jgi:hypothetical protein
MRILRNAAQTRTQAELLPLVRSHFQALLDDRGDWNLSTYDMAWILCTDFSASRSGERGSRSS